MGYPFNIESLNAYERSRKRSQTSFVIPAWRKGDRVLHRPTGFYGELVEMATAGGELWKLKILGSHVQGVTVPAAFPKAVNVHACDLELRT